VLTVHAKNLMKANYPLSIDPSVVVTSTEDFEDGNNEGNIAFDSGALRRSNVSGGSIGSWTSTTSIGVDRVVHTSVAYNGYVYVIGGADDNTYQDDVFYAPINSNGTIGSWTPTTTLPLNIVNHASAVYNGYIYVLGG